MLGTKGSDGCETCINGQQVHFKDLSMNTKTRKQQQKTEKSMTGLSRNGTVFMT